MRNIDHHSLAVHFADDVFAEIGESVVDGFVGGRIRPLVVVKVGKSHVADAEIGENAHHADIVADHVAALNAHKRGDFALRVSAAHVIGGDGEHDVVRIFPDVFADGVDLIEGFFDGGRAGDASVDPDGKEDGVHAAFLHVRNVDVAGGVLLAEVVVWREEALRGVIVRVEHDGREVQLMRTLRNFVAGRNSGQDGRGDDA